MSREYIVRLKDIAKINQNSYSKKDEWEYINYLDTGNITENTLHEVQYIDLDVQKLPSRAKRKVKSNSIIYSTVRPNQLHYGIIKEVPQNFLVSTGFAVIDIDPRKAVADYIYYYLTQKSIIEHLHAVAEQSVSTYPSIKMSDIENIEIKLPDINTQIKVASVLSKIDQKIKINDKINNNLEQQAMAIFKSWFIDYEPFDGDIPNNWIEYKLSDFLPVITGKKNANVASEKGEYPFFSCSKDITWTNEYSFDVNAILVAGNGDFNVKFYNGKFEAYQRTYVLIPNNSRFTAWLYYAVKYNLNKITSAARGSVIKFITKSNLEDFSFHAPNDLDNFFIIDYFQVINNEIAHNNVEISKLIMLRNLILPKLLSGELDVSNIDI